MPAGSTGVLIMPGSSRVVTLAAVDVTGFGGRRHAGGGLGLTALSRTDALTQLPNRRAVADAADPRGAQ